MQSSGSETDNTTYFNKWPRADFQDCMNNCAIARPPCYAVRFADGDCHEYDEHNLPPRNATGSKAVADSAQLASPPKQDLACPYESNSTQTLDSGEEFEILCGQDFFEAGGDYCPWESYPSQCPFHTDSLDECMQRCSDAHPLCKGVSWNPDMLDGYANCYLKQHPQDTKSAGDRVVHSAKVTEKSLQGGNAPCLGDSEVQTGDDDYYDIACNMRWSDGQQPHNMTSVHSDGLDDCLAECSSRVDNC